MGRFLIIFILALFSSAEALANPMWVEMLRASPADGPHVKLVYLVAQGTSDSAAPLLTCHGTSCSPWQADSNTSEDTGSGVKSLRAMHMCDCHVPTGTELKYVPTNKSSYFTSTTLTVPASYQRSPVSGGVCQEECELADAKDAGPADTAPPVATGGSPVANSTAASSGGSCTFTPAGRPTALSFLAVFAGLIVLWRRRS